MSNRQFINDLKAEFKARLYQKTGWGRNEVWVIFIESLVEAQAIQQEREEVDYGDEVRETSVGQSVDEEEGQRAN